MRRLPSTVPSATHSPSCERRLKSSPAVVPPKPAQSFRSGAPGYLGSVSQRMGSAVFSWTTGGAHPASAPSARCPPGCSGLERVHRGDGQPHRRAAEERLPGHRREVVPRDRRLPRQRAVQAEVERLLEVELESPVGRCPPPGGSTRRRDRDRRGTPRPSCPGPPRPSPPRRGCRRRAPSTRCRSPSPRRGWACRGRSGGCRRAASARSNSAPTGWKSSRPWVKNGRFSGKNSSWLLRLSTT